MTQRTDVVVIGGGHAGLAAGYHLRRLGIEFVILDAQAAPGGAWQHTWDSLRLFSPAAYSSLPGRLTPVQPGEVYPDAQHWCRTSPTTRSDTSFPSSAARRSPPTSRVRPI